MWKFCWICKSINNEGLSGALESGTYAGVVAAKHVVFDEYKKMI